MLGMSADTCKLSGVLNRTARKTMDYGYMCITMQPDLVDSRIQQNIIWCFVAFLSLHIAAIFHFNIFLHVDLSELVCIVTKLQNLFQSVDTRF